MPAGWELPDLLQPWSDEDEPYAPAESDSKRDCERCSRPKSVCLCPWLPDAPLQLAGRVVILQHPHELKKRLATVPILDKCLGDIAVLPSRRYQPGKPQHAALQQALEGAAAGRYPLLVLFPGAGARDVDQVAAELHLGGSGSTSGGSVAGSSSGGGQAGCPGGQRQQEGGRQAVQQHGVQQHAQQQQPGPEAVPPAAAATTAAAAQRDPLYVLLVIDGTWKQAKEMFKGLLPYALRPEGPGIRVQLPPLTAAQQAQQQGGALREGSCAQQEGPGAAGAAPAAMQLAAASANEQVAAEQVAAEQAAAAGDADEQATAVQQCCAAAAAELERPLLLRMEPMEGCRTTCEAVARALGSLEPQGRAVRDAVLRPLAQLARFQAQWSAAVAARLETGSGYSQARRRMGVSKLGVLSEMA